MAWAFLQHGGWDPRANVPREPGRSYTAFSNLALAIRHDHFHWILLGVHKGLPSFKVCVCGGGDRLRLLMEGGQGSRRACGTESALVMF